MISYEEQLYKRLANKAFLKGYVVALRKYAWWKDGTQYIGCGTYTLKDAIEDIEKALDTKLE